MSGVQECKKTPFLGNILQILSLLGHFLQGMALH